MSLAKRAPICPLKLAAAQWWEKRRPDGWSLEQHLEQPDVNCDETDKPLARAIAERHRLDEEQAAKIAKGLKRGLF